MTPTQPATVPELLFARAVDRPHAVAFAVIHGRHLTLRDWDARSNAVARGLAAEGVRRGHRVVIQSSPEELISFVIAYAAVLKLAAVAVPIPTSLGDRHLLDAARAARAVGVAGETAVPGIWTLSPDELEGDNATRPFTLRARPDDEAEILFTSGTTGGPKGVVATHRSTTFALAHHPGPQRVVLHGLPPGTQGGQSLVIQALDARPTRMVVMPRFDPAVFVAAVAEHRPTNVMLAPAMALALVNSPAAARLSAASVQIVRTSSAPIAPATLRRLAALFKRAKVVNVLSSTESWPGRATMVYDPLRPDSLGRSEQGGTLRVVGDDGAVLPPDEVGHLELRQPGAPQRRYLDDPEATASVFRAEGWVRTGDLARLDTDGYVHMVDRETDRINSGGVKVSSIEVEATLLEHPGVVDAAVIGLPHPSLGEYVAAVLRVTPDFDRTALNAFLAQELGDDRAPKRIVVVDELPRNALGKVLKRRLRDELTARDAADAGAAAAEERDELHETVRSIWGTALDREDRIAWDMPFLAGGGDSLSANAIAAAVRRRLGREVSVRDVFEAETLSRFADRVKRAEPARKAPADRIERVAREEA